MNNNLCLTAKSVSFCLLKSNCLCNWTRALPMHMFLPEGKEKAELSQNIDSEWCVCFERKTSPGIKRLQQY